MPVHHQHLILKWNMKENAKNPVLMKLLFQGLIYKEYVSEFVPRTGWSTLVWLIFNPPTTTFDEDSRYDVKW